MKDLCLILGVYENSIEDWRLLLFNVVPAIFWDTLRKKSLSLASQELYERDDLVSECFLAIDYLFIQLAGNWRKKPIFKKKKVIWFRDIVLSCREIKGYVYQTMARTIQNMATEKNTIRVPFNKNWTASNIMYSGASNWLSLFSISSAITYWNFEVRRPDIDEPYADFNYINDINSQYIYSILCNIIDKFEYEDKKIFIQKHKEGMSASNMAKDWGISKNSMLWKIHSFNKKITTYIRDEKINIGTIA